MSILFMWIFWEIFDGEVFKEFIYHATIFWAHSEDRHMQTFSENFRFLLCDRSIVYQVHFCLYENHGNRPALLLNGFLPLLDMIEALPICCWESNNTGRCALVVTASEWIVFFLPCGVPDIKLNLVAQFFNLVLFLKKVYSQGLLVLFKEDIFDKFCDQASFANLYWL